MTATIELERIIRIIEKTEDKETLRELYDWLKENNLMKDIPRRLWKKLIDSQEPEELTPEEEASIEEALKEESIPHEQLKKEAIK